MELVLQVAYGRIFDTVVNANSFLSLHKRPVFFTAKLYFDLFRFCAFLPPCFLLGPAWLAFFFPLNTLFFTLLPGPLFPLPFEDEFLRGNEEYDSSMNKEVRIIHWRGKGKNILMVSLRYVYILIKIKLH